MNKQENPLKEYEFLYEALSDKRGLDITGIHLQELSSVADIFVLVTANSDVHMATLRDAAIESLKNRGIQTAVEGYDSVQWCLVDAGDLLVHILSKTGREHYKLEKIWGDAPTYHYTYQD